MRDRFLIQKMSGGAVRSADEWGIELTSCPALSSGLEVKELASNDWYDEHGLDEYIPDELPMKSQDVTFEMVYHGEPYSGMSNIKSFITFLCSGGSNKIYCSRTREGRQAVRFKSYTVKNSVIDSGCDDVVLFSLTMQINDPVTEIFLTKDG